MRRHSGVHAAQPAGVGRWWGRDSVLVRLVAMAMAIAACSIAATAWIASANTSQSIQQQYTDDLATGARIYDAMLSYSATHPTWDGVGAVIEQLAAQTGRRIALTTVNGDAVYDSAGASDRPGTPTAVVDPLSVSAFPGLTTSAGTIDPRAVGPFHLTEAEAAATRQEADRYVACLQSAGILAITRVLPTGRTIVDDASTDQSNSTSLVLSTPTPALASPPTMPQKAPEACPVRDLYAPTDSESRAAEALSTLYFDCLRRSGLGGPLIHGVGSGGSALALHTDLFSETVVSTGGAAGQPCLDGARRQQLAGYVAPRALLYLTGSVTTTLPTGLSPPVRERIVLSGLVILVVAVGMAALAAVPLVRPLHALIVAAQRVGAGDRTARVTTGDAGQIGALTTAFNKMARELESAERQRKQMVSDIAHELRTPLGNIRGWLEATQDGVATFNPQLAQSLLDESLLLHHVIDDLQDLALAEAGELVFHPEPMDAAAMVRQVAAAHLAKAEAAGIRIVVDAPPSIQLTADVSRLRQAVGNLVTNAVRYTMAGGVVTLRAVRVAEPVTIAVSDTGIGIRAADLPHVFDRFWRAEQSRSRSSGGSGLGLAITRHLVEAQGGTITVHSEHGVGSVFTIELPAAE